MNEMEKAAAGLLYDANCDPDLLAKRRAAKVLVHRFNALPPDEEDARREILKKLLGATGETFVIEGPFYCDYGFNIAIGEHFYANVNLVILDGAEVTIGSNVFLAPNVGIYTAGHTLDPERRNAGLEYAHPVTIADNVWIGADVSILPGVTIGEGAVIGAGAVVRCDVPSNVICAGNPARIIREITAMDRKQYSGQAQ